VRLYLLLIEDVAQRALSQFGKAAVSLRRPMLTLLAERQFDRLPPSRHEINPRFRIKQSGYKSSQQK
jgi:hypothetical protein